jgi:GntR family transcriptional regulator
MDQLFDENQPIYLQIKYRICAMILRGEYRPGDKLPAVIDAAMFYKVNHNTIQRVYLELVRDGIAVTRRGEGTFVTQDTSKLKTMETELLDAFISSFIDQMVRLGYREDEIAGVVRQYLDRNHTGKE